MNTQDTRLPVSDKDDPEQTIGRVNVRQAEDDDFGSGWTLRAVLFGILAVAIMLVTLLIVLQWALGPLTA